MNHYRLLINGKLTSTTDSFAVVNPASGEVFAQAPECSEQQLDQAVGSAQQAFPQWGQDHNKRKAALMDMANAIQQQSKKIAEVLTLEQGPCRQPA